MFIPAARQNVRTLGRPGQFIILAVNREEAYAYVVPLSAGDFMEEIRFTDLEPLPAECDDHQNIWSASPH